MACSMWKRAGMLSLIVPALLIAGGCSESPSDAGSAEEASGGQSEQAAEQTGAWASATRDAMTLAREGIETIGQGFSSWTDDPQQGGKRVKEGIQKLDKASSQLEQTPPPSNEGKELHQQGKALIQEYIALSEQGLKAAEAKDAQKLSDIANQLKDLNQKLKEWNAKVKEIG
ncbi:hypothetical protein C8P63_103197 [Melghirimyces profundicolus]|uniref:Uncharacterized protein n=1 Tax=Melghirimyces profundicolus TaxID=1242148 RepID=A0A2T6C7W7_9BACL|nr:hypothetical protein [Melghirimyces profundicolus]PTX64411.1 hypothetical protein C8P63_103197 [Melghirimyces profundicolus]